MNEAVQDIPPRFEPGKEGAVLADTNQLPWYSLGEGIEFQLLRYSRVTGEVHKEARTDELTEFLFLGRGPVSYPDEEGNIQFILDWEFLKRITEGEDLERVT
jgi:hypothetical protein